MVKARKSHINPEYLSGDVIQMRNNFHFTSGGGGGGGGGHLGI